MQGEAVIETRIQKAIAWWMSAPIDEKSAVALALGIWTIFAAVLLAVPSPALP
jgi:uncharacterized membrane protein (GlpM family)